MQIDTVGSPRSIHVNEYPLACALLLPCSLRDILIGVSRNSCQQTEAYQLQGHGVSARAEVKSRDGTLTVNVSLDAWANVGHTIMWQSHAVLNAGTKLAPFKQLVADT